MADSENFHCSVVTPERAVLDCEARFVAFPAWDGEIGVLRGRAPLLCRLGIGVLRIEIQGEKGGETRELYIDGGFAQMVDDRLTLLTEQARNISELDRGEARKTLEEAQAMKGVDERAFKERQSALERGRVQLRLTAGTED